MRLGRLKKTTIAEVLLSIKRRFEVLSYIGLPSTMLCGVFYLTVVYFPAYITTGWSQDMLDLNAYLITPQEYSADFNMMLLEMCHFHHHTDHQALLNDPCIKMIYAFYDKALLDDYGDNPLREPVLRDLYALIVKHTKGVDTTAYKVTVTMLWYVVDDIASIEDSDGWGEFGDWTGFLKSIQQRDC